MKLNSDNHWSYTWIDLAKFEDGKELDYSIKETEIPDGYTGKVEIDKDGHFILTNTHQVKSIEPTEASEPEEPRKPKKASQPVFYSFRLERKSENTKKGAENMIYW